MKFNLIVFDNSVNKELIKECRMKTRSIIRKDLRSLKSTYADFYLNKELRERSKKVFHSIGKKIFS